MERKLFILNNELELKGSNMPLSLLTCAPEVAEKPAGDEAAQYFLDTGLPWAGAARENPPFLDGRVYKMLSEDIWYHLLVKLVASGSLGFSWQVESHTQGVLLEKWEQHKSRLHSTLLHGWFATPFLSGSQYQKCWAQTKAWPSILTLSALCLFLEYRDWRLLWVSLGDRPWKIPFLMPRK